MENETFLVLLGSETLLGSGDFWMQIADTVTAADFDALVYLPLARISSVQEKDAFQYRQKTLICACISWTLHICIWQ